MGTTRVWPKPAGAQVIQVRSVPTAIATRQPFSTSSGGLNGMIASEDDLDDAKMVHPTYRMDYVRAVQVPGSYVIHSYGIPIAWYHPDEKAPHWTVQPQPSSRQHYRLILRALGLELSMKQRCGLAVPDVNVRI